MAHKVGRRLEKAGHFALCLLLKTLRASCIDHSSSSASAALEPLFLEFLQSTAMDEMSGNQGTKSEEFPEASLAARAETVRRLIITAS